MGEGGEGGEKGEGGRWNEHGMNRVGDKLNLCS